MPASQRKFFPLAIEVIRIPMTPIVAIGDSLTFGFPFGPRVSWVQITADALGIPILNKGICGEVTGEIRCRFDRDVIANQPHTVLILGGSNDAFCGICLQEVADNLTAMIESAQSHAIRPVLGLPTPCNYREEEERLTSYRRWIRAYAAHEKIPVLDFYTALLAPSGKGLREGLDVDGIHPNVAGYQHMAAAAIAALQLIFPPHSKPGSP